MMEKSRRSFLKVAGIAAIGLGAAPAINFASSDSNGKAHAVKSKNEEALSAKRWGMVIDTNKLTKEVAEAAIEACHKAHNVPDFNHEVDEEKFPNTRPVNHKQEIKWLWEEEFHYAFPDKEDEFLAEKYHHLPFLVTCNHCKNAPCVQACPTQATFKRKDGIVLMDFHRCIGCRFCMAACPYGARSFNFRDPRPFIEEVAKDFPTRSKGVVEKCNLCAERLANGEQPHCVEASEGAIVVGDLEDPESEVRALLNEHYTIRRKQSLGTEPSVYYVM
ncbi:MAG: 4Fe-4S dicluster domain-containing protein [Proteobacteria bacterium]|nr:4Fe-4S dicluster domain-containing protein [Pseudomonadota bacterium]MBU1389244.1 4Fe-4S dicluster domain-containing protein [Pseudomonadota bacterium]MBU1544064.1 4Fe-4S dicluster domain-containing protein [Pseudomonadota bacterium]MBU2430809.1 4Fe-4S dicluster domain-containing protein [Pseudomonadota bacterium]MBU2480251.1 4Fe-4S dicluster domain-containing protein [Pseudomonadota bacterium]